MSGRAQRITFSSCKGKVIQLKQEGTAFECEGWNNIALISQVEILRRFGIFFMFSCRNGGGGMGRKAELKRLCLK